jgi:putative PIN family toxin of toxin-antitoxin system
MKVVIDTNVLVSAVITAGRARKIILFVVDHPDIDWVVTDAILTEYAEVLARPKFKLTASILSKWSELVQSSTTHISATRSVELPRDPTDAKFLSCAASCSADFLITGDKDMAVALRIENTTILSVDMFDRLVIQRLS